MKKLRLALVSAIALLAWGQATRAVAAEALTIDASQYTQHTGTKGTTYDITITNLDFEAGAYRGFSMPFDLTKSLLDAAFPDGYALWEYTAQSGEKYVFSEVTVGDDTTLPAGTPYIIKSTSAVTSATFSNVVLQITDTADYKKVTYDDVHYFRASQIRQYAYQLVFSTSGISSWTVTSGGAAIDVYSASYTDKMLPVFNAYLYAIGCSTTPTIAIGGSSGSGDDSGSSTIGYTDISGTTKLGLGSKIAHREQLTDVPTIYLDIPDVEIINTDLVKDAPKGDNGYFKATIQVVDNSDPSSEQHLESFTDSCLEIKVRGNSTAAVGNGKRPYRLKFNKKSKAPDGKAHKHDLLGLGYSKRNWTLLANAFDGSMIRNALTYHLGKYVGMDFCPGYKFVDLVINGDYRGTYQVSDHVEVGSNRVDIDEDNDWFLEGVSWNDMVEQPATSGGEPYMCVKNPEPETEEDSVALMTAVEAWRTKWLAAFDNADAATGWQSMNDMESFKKFYTAINITGDLDGWFVFKGYRTPTGPFYWGPIWDKDLAYGNHGEAIDDALVENYGKCIFENNIQKLQTQRAFITEVKAYMDKLVDDGICDKLCDDVDKLAALIDSTQKLNYQLYAIGDMSWAKVQKESFSGYIEQLKDYLKMRIPLVKSKLESLANSVPAVVSVTYNPENTWWSTGLEQMKEYNMGIENRTLQGEKWNTFCLPVSASQEQMEKFIGCKYELLEHSSMDGETMVFSRPDTLCVIAGMPYLIKPEKDVAQYDSLYSVYYALNVTNNSSNPYNGELVTYDDKHYFGASLFHGYELSTSTDYIFNNDIYESNDASFTLTTADNQKGCRTYIRTTDGSTPVIRIDGEAEEEERQQLSDLPTIYIDTQDGAEIEPSSGSWVSAGIEVVDKNKKLAPFKQEAGTTAAGNNILQVRGRGTTSWTNTDKKSFRLQFAKDDKDATTGEIMTSYKHYLLGNETAEGVVKKRNWVLLANAGDKTLVRNALTKELGDIAGLPFTPGYCFVDLVVNGQYVGTYQVTEYLEADANRINIDEDDGLLLQMTGSADIDATDHIIEGADFTKPYLTIKNPDVKKKKRSAWNAAFCTDVYDFDTMWDATDGTGLDKETLVNWYIASEITGGYEAFSSIYAYKDKDATELSFGPLWNNDASYDNSANVDVAEKMNDLNTDDSYAALMVNAGKEAAWANKLNELWKKTWFASAVYERWSALYANGELTTTLQGKVDQLAAIVNSENSSQKLNFATTEEGGAGWTIAGQGVTDVSKNVTNTAYADEVQRLKDYFTTRMPYLEAKFKALKEAAGIDYDVTAETAIDDLNEYAGQTLNVTLVNRSDMKAGSVNTLCLPFSLTADAVKAKFGDDCEVSEMTAVADGPTLTFKTVTTGIEAGKPYLVKVNQDITDWSFEDVTIMNTVAEGETTVGSVSFRGTLVPHTLQPGGQYWFTTAKSAASGKIYKPSATTTISGAKAYFYVEKAQSANAISIVFDDDEVVTGIDAVNGELPVGDIYNVNGQKMNRSLQSLPQGVYIINGKKITK